MRSGRKATEPRNKMDLSYAITPFAAWLTAGVLKFLINSIKARQLAFGLIGYGGLPSNHSAIVSSMATLIALKEGISHPLRSGGNSGLYRHAGCKYPAAADRKTCDKLQSSDIR